MAKYNRGGKIRRKRRWFLNVGDPIDLKKLNQTNPNDVEKKK